MRCEEVRDHLASCVDCRAERNELDALWGALGDLPLAETPSSRMRERFSAMLAAERASTNLRPASRGDRRDMWTPRRMVREPLVQAALAASLLLVGVLVGRTSLGTTNGSSQSASAVADITEVRQELRDMRQMLTLSLLQQQSATERLRGVSWTSQIDQPGNEVVSALLDTLLHDPNVNVRLAAIDALRRVSDRSDVRAGTRRVVGDTSAPLLQVAAIDFLVETRDPDGPALLQALVDDRRTDEAVRGRAQWGLERLAS